MRPLPEAAFFTTAEAAARGWTAPALRNAVATGRVLRVRRGVYAVPTAEQGPVFAARAAACQYPHAVISHRSAALLHGLPLVGARPPLPEVTVPPRSNGNLAGVHLHRASLRPQDVLIVEDAPVTAPARTVVDLARHRPLYAGVAALDAALNRRMVTMAEIESVLLYCWNWPRIARAERAVDLCDARAESALESISRLTIRHLRLPAPTLQTQVVDQLGRVVARTDFYWDEFGVIGEADGRAKYSDRLVLTDEKERQEELEHLGLIVVRWGWDDAYRHPHRLKQKLERGFERGRLRDRSGFPRLWSL